MKNLRKIISLLLAVSLLFSLNINVFAEDNTLYINTPEQFLEFSQMCRYDAYSDGLFVEITADIDMSGLDFEDIPIFLGTFNGNGYTISGIESEIERDMQGLFRQVSDGATISNLKVKSTIKTEHITIGGIVAENYGTIQNCTFSGIISGLDTIGGIAGANYGTILNCKTYGGIFGETNVGGIAGINEGSVLQSNNFSQVNTDISDFQFSFEDKLVSNINPNSDTINFANIGGIVGTSDGIIQSCINRGAVGYPHVGYNVGGIVGFQSGYVASCINNGFVQGRKEVGGIVGQFEPYIDTLYSISKLQSLRDELDVFSDLTSNLADTAKSSNDLISADFDELGNSIDLSKEHIENLVTQTEDMLNANIDSINEISVTVADTLDSLVPIVDSFDDIIDELFHAISDLEDMADDLGDASRELDGLEDVFEDIDDYIASGNKNLKNGLGYFQTAVNQIDNLAPDLQTIYSVLEQISYYTELGISAISSAYSDFEDAYEEIYEITDILSDANSDLQNALDNLEAGFKNLGDTIEYVGDTNDLVSDLITDLSYRDEIVFTKFDDEYDNTRDELENSLSQISDDMSSINSSVNSSTNLLVDDLDSAGQQMSDILDLVLEMMQDVTSFVEDETYKIEDVSSYDTSEIFAGKITNSKNTGKIEGDINVGGIAGGISFELSLDMEDTFKTDRDKTQSITRQGIAIIEDSTNTGDVVAKKDSAGGILGYQDFGLVQNCTANAFIESTEGDYIGGIVGQSNGYIKNCFSKTNLSGTQFVGGIAGSGFDIQNCYSLSSVTATNGGIGGIVGDLNSDGILKNNFFVSDTLGGLDGISFQGMAEAISYEELLLTENLPQIFEYMTIDFYLDEILFDTIKVPFNSEIPFEDFPTLPVKYSYYGNWEQLDFSKIISDIKITSEYFFNISTIGSQKNSDGISNILVDGSFTVDDILMFTQEDNIYTIWVDGQNTNFTAIRYLLPENDVNFQLYENENWIDVDMTIDGKYAVIPVTADGVVQIRVLDDVLSFNLWILFAIVMVLLAPLFVIHKKRKKIASQKTLATDESNEILQE